MGEQVGAGFFKKIARKSVIYRTDIFQWAEVKATPVL